jgi:hypothetical protein
MIDYVKGDRPLAGGPFGVGAGSLTGTLIGLTVMAHPTTAARCSRGCSPDQPRRQSRPSTDVDDCDVTPAS